MEQIKLKQFFQKRDIKLSSENRFNENLGNIEKRICTFIQDEVNARDRKGGLVCVSGGIDSALTLCLTQKALEAENTRMLILKHKNMNEDDYNDALELLDSVRPKYRQVGLICEIFDVDKIIDSYSEILPSYYLDEPKNYLHLFQTITTGISLNYARRFNYAVIGTGNKTELNLGSFNIGGNVADIFPIADLTKSQVIELSKLYPIPKSIIEKSPRDGIKTSKTDEEYIGLSYDEIEKVHVGLEKGLSCYVISQNLSLPKDKVENLELSYINSQIDLEFPSCDIEHISNEEKEKLRYSIMKNHYEKKLDHYEKKLGKLESKISELQKEIENGSMKSTNSNSCGPVGVVGVARSYRSSNRGGG